MSCSNTTPIDEKRQELSSGTTCMPAGCVSGMKREMCCGMDLHDG